MPFSRIESLPVELLQPIFISSDHNIALLQASRWISARLSSEHIYHSICDQHLTQNFDDRTKQTATQTYIFASKWMTWSFFKAWVTRSYEPVGCLCNLTPEDGCLDPQWPPDFEDATNMVFSRSHLPRLAFNKARIPERLLCGPWIPDNVQFLRFLLWITSMTVDWNSPEAREAAIKGRKRAMMERNLEAVELFNHNRRLGKVADLSTLRFAVMQAGCDRSIVYDTMYTASMWGSSGRDCKELDKWCDDQIRRKDPKGAWLKLKLRELRVAKACGSYGAPLPATGGYDGGDKDKLIITESIWNKIIEVTKEELNPNISNLLHAPPPHHPALAFPQILNTHTESSQKPICQRGWLAIRVQVGFDPQYTRNTPWTTMIRFLVPRMYPGPARPRRTEGTVTEERVVDVVLWLAVPTTRNYDLDGAVVEPIVQLGWFFQPFRIRNTEGLHGTTRAEQADFWHWNKGLLRVLAGFSGGDTRGHVGTIRLSMWVPQRGVEYGGRVEDSDSDSDDESSSSSSSSSGGGGGGGSNGDSDESSGSGGDDDSDTDENEAEDMDMDI